MDLITQNIDLTTGSVAEKRAEIKTYFNVTWELYERLFEVLIEDAVFYEQPQPLRHPLIFYFGHTAVFFVNKLVLAKLLPGRLNSRIESVCAIGDELG